jgi:uncharacterized protein (DUF952 family)
MNYIYHIADRAEWERAQRHGDYSHPSLKHEGFIHCSTASQVEATANLYFSNETQIIVLVIDVSKLKSPLKYELATRGEEFPHVSGAINTDSVVTTKVFNREADGQFEVQV